MLKYIAVIVLILINLKSNANEYEVTISDAITGERVIQDCANESELNATTEYIQSLNDSAVSVIIKKKHMPMTVFAVKRGGGEEGGGD